MLHCFLKGLFLFLDHKIAKEQWLSFKTAALKLLPTGYCHVTAVPHQSSTELPGEEREEGPASVLPSAGGEPACGLRPSLSKKGVLHIGPWGDCPGLGLERKEVGGLEGWGPLSLLEYPLGLPSQTALSQGWEMGWGGMGQEGEHVPGMEVRRGHRTWGLM